MVTTHLEFSWFSSHSNCTLSHGLEKICNLASFCFILIQIQNYERSATARSNCRLKDTDHTELINYYLWFQNIPKWLRNCWTLFSYKQHVHIKVSKDSDSFIQLFLLRIMGFSFESDQCRGDLNVHFRKPETKQQQGKKRVEFNKLEICHWFRVQNFTQLYSSWCIFKNQNQ